MTRTRTAARTDTGIAVLRRRLGFSTALGVTLAVAAPASGQTTLSGQQGSFGTVTGTDSNGGNLIVPSFTLTPEVPAGVDTPAIPETLRVNLQSRNTIVDWNGFNVANGKVVNFADNRVPGLGQGTAQVVLNRVTGGATTIDGQVNTVLGTGSNPAPNLQVWIINTGGILIGSDARFNVGGLVLSTLGMITTDSAFIASNGRYQVQFRGPGGAISGGGGTAELNLRSGASGVLALVAPTVDVNAKFNSGSQATAFALATDVSMDLNVGGPLSLTLNSGTTLDSSVAGTVAGDRVYALLRPQDGINALLAMPATVSNATVDARGAVVLSGAGLDQSVAVTGGNDVLSTGGASMVADTIGRAVVGTVAFATGIGDPAVAPSGGIAALRTTGTLSATSVAANGDVTIAGGGGLTLGTATAGGTLAAGSSGGATSITGALSAAGTITVTAAGTATVGGTVTSTGGGYSVTGASVAIGTTGEARAQSAAGVVSLDATAGTVSSLGTVTLTGDSDDSGDQMLIGGTATTGLSLAGSTIRSGSVGGSPIRFATATGADAFDLGAVDASILSQATAATAGAIDRTGAISFDALRLTAANTITTTQQLLVRGTLNLASTGTTTLTGGTVTLDGDAIGAGTLGIDGGSGGISTQALSNTGGKLLDSDGALLVTGSIAGGGAVELLAGNGSTSRVTGGIGSTDTLAGDVTIDGGLVEIGTVGGAGGIASSGTVRIGQTRAPGSLTLRGTLQAAGDLVATVDGPVALDTLSLAGAANTITATGTSGSLQTGAVTLTQAAGGAAAAKSLTLTGTGVTVGALGEANAVAGAVTINAAGAGAGAASLTTTDLSGALMVDAGTDGATFTTLSGAGSKSITSTGIVSGTSIAGAGAVSLSAGASSALTLTGDIGSASAPVASVTVDRGGTVSLGAVFATGAASFGQASPLGSLQLSGALSAASMLSDTTGATTLRAVTTTGGGIDVAAGGATEITGAVSAAGDYLVSGTTVTLGDAGGTAVTQAASGAVTIAATGGAGAAGAILGRSGLTLTADSDDAGGETLAIGGAATGTIDFTGATLNAGANGTGPLSVASADAADAVALGSVRAGTVTGLARTGSITFDALTLSGASNTIATTGTLSTGAVTLTGAGAKALTLTGRAGTTTGAITEADGATGTVTVNADTGAAAATVASATLGGTLEINAGTGGAVLGALSGAGAKTVRSAGGIGGAGANAAGFATLGSGAVDLLAGATNAITLDGVSATGARAASLTINGGGQVTINGAVNVTGATQVGLGAGTPTGALTVTGALATGSLASRTTGGTSYQAVTTAEDASGTIRAESSGGGAIGFGGAVDGGGTLVTDTTGITRFGGAVGATTPLASLTTLGTGGVAIDGGSVRTVGLQSYGGLVTLGATTVLTGTDGSFAAGVEGGAAFNGLTLTFSGDTNLAADPFTRLGSLVVDGGGTTTLAGDVTTVGGQRWDDAVVLAGDAVLASSNGGDISFAGLSGANALTVNTSGTTTFGAGAGGLAAITTDADGTTVLNGTLSTTGAQRYGDAVRLGSPVTVTSDLAAGDAATFARAVDGAQSLTVTTAGTTVFGGFVGGTDALASLTVNGGGTTVLAGGGVTTTGAQTYTDLLSLGANTVLSGASGSFAGGVAGNGFALTLDFGGTVDIGDGFGGVGDIDVTGAARLSGTVNTTGGQRYRGAVTLGGATTLQSGGGTGTGTIQFGSTIDGAQALTVTTGGTTRFDGVVGGSAPLASLAMTGTGPIALNAGIPSGGSTVSTTGIQRYVGPVTLGADTRLATTGGGVTFEGTMDGAHLLSVATGGTGAAGFGGRVGGTTALTGLAVRTETATFGATGNRVGTLAANVRAGGLTYDDAAALTVGTVDGLSGIVTTGDLSLTAVGITQNADAPINTGAGTITLDGNDAAMALNGPLTTTNATAGAVRIVDASSLALGSVTAAAGTVTLGGATGDAITETITQGANATLLADTLTGNAGGAVTLTNAGNAITTLGAFAANGFGLRESNGLRVTGPVDAGTGDLTLALDAGALALAGNLTAASGLVTLDNPTGTIDQTAGAIVADRLTGRSSGGAVLRSESNTVRVLAGFTNTGARGFELVNSRDLSITQNVAGGASLSIVASAIRFPGQTLSANGAVSLDGRDGVVIGSAVIGNGVGIGGGLIDVGLANANGGSLQAIAGGTVTIGTGNAGGDMLLRSDFDRVGFGSLTGAGAKRIVAATSINGGSIAGAGAVRLLAGAATTPANTITVGTIGAAGAVASLTVNGGSQVTLGTAGSTINVAGATRIGLVADGAATGALTINGTVDSDASFTAVTTGAIATGAIDSVGALGLNAGTDLAVGALSGAGDKTLTAGGAITGTSIDAGAVRIRAGASTVAANTVRLDSVGATTAVGLLAINGGSAVTIAGTVRATGAVTIGQGTAAADLTGALTIGGAASGTSFASTTTGATTLASVTSDGAITLTTTGAGGDVRFDRLVGNGEKRIAANGSITGTLTTGPAISGTGAVTLTPTATGNVSILGGIGEDAVRVASLTVGRGGAVQVGPVFVTGAASFGQTSPLGSLTLGTATVGSLTSTSTGPTQLASVTTPGEIRVTATGATGDILFTALTGAGDKRLTAGRSIGGTGTGGTGATIDGGAATLVAGTADATGTVTLDAAGTGTTLTALTIDGGAGVTIGRSGNAGAAVAVSGATAIGRTTRVGALTINGTTATGSLQANSTGATVLTGGVTASGGAIGIDAGSIQAQTLVATGAVIANAGGSATLVGGSSGGTADFAVTAGGAARVSGAVAAGGAYRVRGAGVSLGTGTTAQTARGLVDIVTTGGTLTGSTGLTLASNTDGAGGEYLAIDANGGIEFAGVALVGGTSTNRSDVSVVERAAGAGVALGTATGRQLGSFNAARTAIGTLSTSGPVTIAGLVDVQRGLAIASTGGAIAVDAVQVTDAGQGITLTTTAPAGGAITARSLVANTSGAIAVDARGAAQVGTSDGGATSVRGTSARIDTAIARGTLGLTATAGSATLGTGDAGGAAAISATGGDAEVTTRLTAAGATTIGATGAARLNRVLTTVGDLAVTAGGTVTGVGGGRGDLSATGTGASLRVQAGGAALLGTVQAANAVTVQASAIDATSTVATAGALSLTAGAGNVTLGSGSAGTSALLDATGTVASGAVTAGGNAAITVRALDAALTGALRAGQVNFVNRAPAGNPVKLGTGTSTGGFQLSAAEINLVDAATLVFDGGAGNVEFGTLAFGANAGRTTVDILSTGRIDILGAVTASGSGRTFRLGGTAGSTETKAGVIQLVTTATGGGRLLVDTANLDLRGTRIGAGQAPGFLDTLGFTAGGTAASVSTVGELFVGNANSSLYNSTFGGAPYNPSGVTFLSASTLTVRYTDYALFQNTGVPGINAGVTLGSQAAATSNALVLQGSGTNNPNSFALFGTINGITGTPTAVLGPTVISVNNVSLPTTRVNGCIVGSGAGCLTSVVSQPVLNVFDASRLDVFRTADDLALPFDPVIGTNNEALFSGITLTDVPVTSTDCAEGTDSPQCRQPRNQTPDQTPPQTPSQGEPK